MSFCLVSICHKTKKIVGYSFSTAIPPTSTFDVEVRYNEIRSILFVIILQSRQNLVHRLWKCIACKKNLKAENQLKPTALDFTSHSLSLSLYIYIYIWGNKVPLSLLNLVNCLIVFYIVFLTLLMFLHRSRMNSGLQPVPVRNYCQC